MTTLPGNEKTLFGHYQRQAARYRQVLELVRGLPTSIEQGSSIEESLSRMNSMLDEIHGAESRISRLRDLWLASQSRPGRDFAQAVQAVRELIESLMESVDVAEQAARKAKTRLFPEMNAESLGRKMRTAYTSAREQVTQRQT
jgi:hypothetical protein